MDRALGTLCSPALVAGLAAAVLWAPVTGYPTWAALGRGRVASTVLLSLAVGGFVFVLVQRFGALLGD